DAGPPGTATLVFRLTKARYARPGPCGDLATSRSVSPATPGGPGEKRDPGDGGPAGGTADARRVRPGGCHGPVETRQAPAWRRDHGSGELGLRGKLAVGPRPGDQRHRRSEHLAHAVDLRRAVQAR